jgi:chromosome segregation ATPase
VEGAIRITDDVVAEKEAEIKQLQRQLEDVRTERKSAASHDAEAASILDHDAVIAAERERLRKLQESCLDKQRETEVELSVERARLARQRVELEERMHAMETDLSRRQAAGNISKDQPAGGAAKSSRGRWLARLGLSHDDAAG